LSENVFVPEQTQEPEVNFATIGTVYADGATLIFDGETEPTTKHYKCNSAIVFAAGNRVRIIRDSGTYVVEYPVGNPKTTFAADSAAKLTTARTITISDADGDNTGAGITFDGSENKTLKLPSKIVAEIDGPSDHVYDYNTSGVPDRFVYFRVTSSGKLQFRSSYYSSSTWHEVTST